MATAAVITPASASKALQKEFAFFKYRSSVGDTSDDNKAQQPITVKGDAFWSYCGPLLHLDSQSSPSASSSDLSSSTTVKNADDGFPNTFHEFAHANIDGPLLERLLPFLAFTNDFLTARGLNHYFLTVRASTPTHEFDQPRWHTDDKFFEPPPGSAKATKKRQQQQAETDWKICTTVLGASTLFIPLTHQPRARRRQKRAQDAARKDHAHRCVSIRCVGCAAATECVRKELATKLASMGTEAAAEGQCAVLRSGPDGGAVHSEPPSSEDPRGRVFVNVVPGTEEELRDVMERWGMEYPRQWWVGSTMPRSSRMD